jgi:hypothetical protein
MKQVTADVETEVFFSFKQRMAILFSWKKVTLRFNKAKIKFYGVDDGD